MTTATERAYENLRERLAENRYPGRGLILGLDQSGRRLVQVYWIMGRSENSRNRVFEQEEGRVWTAPADPAKCKDPSLIIYNAAEELKDLYVVTNGDQTDTIVRAVSHGGGFEEALSTREHEPDAPNFTPRISGIFDLRSGRPIGKISIIRRSPLGARSDHIVWTFESWSPGLGLCVTTYRGDGDPIPPFAGDPYLLPLEGAPGDMAGNIWAALNEANRVALFVKTIELRSRAREVVIINRFDKIG